MQCSNDTSEKNTRGQFVIFHRLRELGSMVSYFSISLPTFMFCHLHRKREVSGVNRRRNDCSGVGSAPESDRCYLHLTGRGGDSAGGGGSKAYWTKCGS